jgi:hypothetical protein
MDLLKSPRFVAILIIGLLQALALFDVISSAQGEGLIQIFQAVIAGAVLVRTVDRNADKSVEAALIQSGVSPERAKDIA